MPRFSLLALLAAQMALGNMDQTVVDARAIVVRRAIAEVVIMTVCYLFLFVQGRGALRSLLRPTLRYTFLICLSCVVGTIVGLAFGNSLNYITGDVYRFLRLPAIVLASYLTIAGYRDRMRAADTLLFWAVLVTVAFLLFDITALVLIEGSRARLWTVSVQFLPWYLVIIAYLFTRPQYRRRWLFFGMASLVFALGILMSQTRTLLALFAAVLIGVVTSLPVRKLRLKVGAVFAGGLFVLFAGVLLSTELLDQWQSSLARLQGTSQLYDDATARDAYYRLLEARTVVSTFIERPYMLLVGAGLGSTVRVTSNIWLEGQFVRTSAEIHYIHNAYLEVLYRTGAVGIGCLGLFFSWLFKRIDRGCGPLQRWTTKVSLFLFLGSLLLFDSVFECTIFYVLLGAFLAVSEQAVRIYGGRCLNGTSAPTKMMALGRSSRRVPANQA